MQPLNFPSALTRLDQFLPRQRILLIVTLILILGFWAAFWAVSPSDFGSSAFGFNSPV
jgi:hypothetical protein